MINTIAAGTDGKALTDGMKTFMRDAHVEGLITNTAPLCDNSAAVIGGLAVAPGAPDVMKEILKRGTDLVTAGMGFVQDATAARPAASRGRFLSPEA